ncbi:MAG TPA: phosphoadenosine phosphosulfate reductase family protein [Thauera aminoaromatica]|nr:phosphoadenosine phosphosulfate reductase family protein [Thauera aminoaromatica]
MRDPFLIDGPTCISFSGGRTSAYMLWRVLDSNGGLPDEAQVCFENTGKEDEATLRFVRECGSRWGVRIRWLEYRTAVVPADRWAKVDFDSASRDGEPFEAAIRQRQFLPNPITRFCTVELKIRTAHRFLRSLGWTEWDQMVGIRADEQRRVAKIRARPSPEIAAETMTMPLADAGVTLADVHAFWSQQSFGLELRTVNGRTLAGNCDLCFLKPAAQVMSLIAEKPARAAWWARMEALALASTADGARFRNDRPSYSQMAQFAVQQGDLFDHDEEALACFCGE